MLLLLLQKYLKCHWRKLRSFSAIEAILKHKQVACIRRKMLFTIFKYLFLFQRYSSFTNKQISQVMTSYDQPTFLSNVILCSKILLKVLDNLSVTVLLPWQQPGFQTSPILKAFLATFDVPFSYLQIVRHLHDPTSI